MAEHRRIANLKGPMGELTPEDHEALSDAKSTTVQASQDASQSANQAGQDAAAVRTAREELEEMFRGGTDAISDAAVEQYMSTEGMAAREFLLSNFASLEEGKLAEDQVPGLPASQITSEELAPERMPLATTSTRGALRPEDQERLNQAIIASDLSEGIKSAALAGHGEMTGEDGKTYNLIGGVIRPPTNGGDWVLHTNSTHPTVGVHGIETEERGITLNYSGNGHTGVVSFLAVPDETLAKHGVTTGCSVTNTSARIELGGRVGYGGQIRWRSGVGVYVNNNDSHSDADEVTCEWDSDGISISHPRLPIAHSAVSPKVSGRTGHLYQIHERITVGANGFGISRRDLSSGDLNTSQSDVWAMFENYTHGRLNPRLFEGEHWRWANIWYLGVFQTSPAE